MGVIRQTLKSLLTAGLPPERWLVRGPQSRLSDVPSLSLTFDDGPHPEHTPRLLDELQRWNQRATFFLIGRDAERHTDMVERIVAEGHLLGNHTFTHSEPAQTSATVFLDELRRTDELLSRWTGEPCRWVRPPKGELTLSKLRGVLARRQTVVLWNVDPRDYRMRTEAEGAAWADRYTPRQGDIVLLHDCYAAATTIVRRLGERGVFERWRSVTIGEWLFGDRRRHGGLTPRRSPFTVQGAM